MGNTILRVGWAAVLLGSLAGLARRSIAADSGGDSDSRGYWVCVSNEKSGDVTVIDGSKQEAIITVRVGPRPRGIDHSASENGLAIAEAD